MVAFARTSRTPAQVASAYAVLASEGLVRAERYRGPLGEAGSEAMRGLLRVAKAAPPLGVLRTLVAGQLDALVARVTRIVGQSLRREGAWSSEALWGVWDDLTPSPLTGGEFRESLRPGEDLAEARESKTSQYRKIITNTGWEERLDRWSLKITKYDPIADIIANGIARRASLETIASRVQPYVQGYANSAMRIVRTETARVHNEIAENTFREHEDVISGYRIMSQLDSRVRPAHAARHGRFYGQGRTRPSLPDAPNCRCYYVPILRDPTDYQRIPGFQRFQELAFDDRSYDDWFSKQTSADQRKIVGKTRWEIVRSKGIRKVHWEHFSNMRNGELLSVKTLKKFTLKQLQARRK